MTASATAATTRRNLVICPVGDASYHPAWLNGAPRNFDLLLIYYGDTDGRFRQDADYYLQSGGTRSKLERIAEGYEAWSAQLAQYSSICLPDNDIYTTARSLNRLFDEFERFELDWGHPSIAWPCFSGVPLQWHNPLTRIRFVNGTEMLCPVFKRDLFLRLLPTFGTNRSAWGIDLLWAQMLQHSGARIAILDAVVFYHLNHRLRWRSGPVRKTESKDYYQEMRGSGVNSLEEFTALTRRINFGLGDLRETGRKQRGAMSALWASGMALARVCRVLLSVNVLRYARDHRTRYLRLILRPPSKPPFVQAGTH
jgi:hypothetical protein